MSQRIKLFVAVAVVLTAACVMWIALTAERMPQVAAAQLSSFIEGQCTEPEAVDRWLLQQSWFRDQAFTQLAGGFGQLGFSLYKNTSQLPLEGVYCINGNKLVVRYYERVIPSPPILFPWRTGEVSSTFRQSGRDIFEVKALDTDRMVLRFESDGREYVFYRKN